LKDVVAELEGPDLEERALEMVRRMNIGQDDPVAGQ
jgi:hypothetical protein